MTAIERVIDAAHSLNLTTKDMGDGRYMVQCPAHADKRPSLSVKQIEGSVLLYCMAGCHTSDVAEALGLAMSELFDEPNGMTYRYPGGREVHRTPDKKFVQSGNRADRSLFRADRVTDETVFVVEGEKDVLAIESAGGQAVSAPNGASAAPEKYDWSPLAGKGVRIIRDRDEAGRKRAADLLRHLESLAGSVAVFDPAAGKDAADHIAAGFSLEEFRPQIPDEIITLSQAYDSWLAWRDDERDPPIPTPWGSMNRALAGGLHAGRMYVIAARTGVGKSVAGQNIVSHAVGLGQASLVVSVEMPVVEVVSRIISAQARVDYSTITRRDFSEELTEIDRYIQGSRNLPMFICDQPTVTIERVEAFCRSLRATSDLKLLFLDYAQLIAPTDRRVARQEQVAHIARRAKLIAMHLNIVVVLAAQLNRGAESDQEGRTPRISDLRESGELEQSADVIMLLHKEHDSQSVVCNIAKNRTGQPKSISLFRRYDQARLDAI